MKSNQDHPADALPIAHAAGGGAAELRRRAEERSSKKAKSQRPAEDNARLVQELQVHQLELEMQNEELQTARTEVEALYAELYDFAPTGYLTLDREGVIRQVNLTGARLFDAERSRMVKHRLGQFIAEGDRSAISDFLQKVFANDTKESCEVTLPQAGRPPLFVRIEGTHSADGQECRVVVVDLTARHRAEEILRARLRLMQFAKGHSVDELLQQVLDEVGTLTESPVGFYHFVEADQKTLSLQAWSTGTMREFCRAEGKGRHHDLDRAGVWVDCIRQRRAVIHNEYAALPNRRGLPPDHAPLVRELVVPIIRQDLIVAVLGVGNKPRNYTEKDVELVAFMADVAWEIVEHKRAEEDLKASEVRYRRLFESAKEGILLLDAETGMVVDVNPFLIELLGYSRQVFIEKKVWELGFFKDTLGNQRNFKELQEKGYVRYEDIALETSDGRRIEAEFVNYTYWVNHRKVIQCNIRDISQRRQAEEQNQRLATAIEQVHDSIVVTDVGGAIRYVNPAFERITGYTRKEALGQNPRIVKSGKQDAAFYRQMWETLTRGEVWRGHFINKKKDGTLFEADATISPVRNAAGQIINYVAVQRDVTHEAQLEAQLRQAQKMEAIGQLSGGVAHDFNNILSAMMLQVELSGMVEDLPKEVRDGLLQILAGAERAAGLTRQLLLFSRKQVMQSRDLDLNEIVTSVAKMLQRLIGDDVRLDVNLHPGRQSTHADAGMIEQVIMNLVVNARDAMPAGGRIVIETNEKHFTEAEAASIPDAKPGRYVSLRVTDTGCGIAPENLSRIFEPFFTTKEPGKGTGLGLATVFGIVKQHGGSINVESEVGRGTTFQVCLPATEDAGDSPGAAAVEPKLCGGTETILLVEDDSAVRSSTRAMLQRFGYRVLDAPNGIEALRIWEQDQDSIRLLLTDRVMPEGVSGHELAARLQARNPSLRVVFTSGYSADLAGQELTLQEGRNFIQKPGSLRQLLQTVRQALDS